MATFYLDFESGNDALDGTTFANRWKTVTSGATAARIAPGDVVRIMGSPAPTSLGINATWTNKSSTVTLASALNLTVTDCNAIWTAAANVTALADTSYFRTGTASASLSIAAAFTTGLVGYFATGLLDLSAYQGITLWVQMRTAALAASTLSVRLCSDVAGAVTVDTLAIPAISVIDCWTPIYIDKGSALGASIQSIAVYADLDPGTAIVYLDNIVTVKAAGNDALTHRKLIGKSSGADELWWCIREISGVTLSLDGTPYNAFGTNQRVGRGYWGTTETVATSIREVIVVPQTTGTFASVQDSGTAGNLISFTGGWNRTDMSTQTLETWVDGSGALGTFWWTNSKDYIHVDLLHGVRWDYALYHEASGAGCTFGTVKAGHCRTGGIHFRVGGVASATELTGYGGSVAVLVFAPENLTITRLRSISAGLSATITQGLTLASINRATITTLEIRNAAWNGLAWAASNNCAHCVFTTVTITDCGNHGFVPGPANYLRIGTLTVTNCTSNYGILLDTCAGRIIVDTVVATGNNYGLSALSTDGAYVTIGSYTSSGSVSNISVAAVGGLHGIVEILASSIGEATKVSTASASFNFNPYGRVTFRNYLGVADDHRSWVGGYGNHGTLTSDAVVRRTASGLAWKLSPLNATYVTSKTPLRIPLATVRVAASTLVTVKLWLRRTNTGLTGTLFCRGGQLSGVAADVSASITVAADTWEEVTITFTPSVAGAIDLEVVAYGGATYSLYYDDLSITQA